MPRAARRRAYAVGAALVLLTAGSQLALRPLVGADLTFLFLLPSVIAAGWLGGFGPAFCAGVLNVAIVLAMSWARLGALAPDAVTRSGGLLISAAMIGALCEQFHRARRRAVLEISERKRRDQMLEEAEHLAHVGSWELALDNLEDLNANILRWSDESYRIFGYEPGSVPVTNALFFKAVHPDDHALIIERVANTLRTRTPYEVQHRVVWPDGSERFIRQRATVRTDDRGQLIALLGTCQDITDQKRAEQAVRDQEALLQLITDAAPPLISYIGPDLRYRFANQGYRRWFGADPATIRGRHVREVLGEAAWEKVKAFMARALAGEVVSYEQHLPYREGGGRWVDVTYTPDVDQKGRVRGFVVLVNDISERHRLFEREAAARQAAEAARNEALGAQARMAFLAQASRVLSSSLEVGRTFWDVAELTVPAVADYCVLYDAQAQPLAHAHCDAEGERQLQEALQLPWDVGYLVPADAGQVRLIEAEELRAAWGALPPRHREALANLDIRSHLVVPLAVRSRVLGALHLAQTRSGRRFTATDIQLAQELGVRAALAMEAATLYRQAQEAAKTREDFLSVAAHELKTPVTALQLVLQSSLRQADRTAELTPDRWRGSLARLETQVKRISQLVDQLLDVSRLAAGRFAIRRQRFNLTDVVREVCLRFQDAAERAGSSLAAEVLDTVEGEWDRERIEQVVTNLVSNAIKYGGGRPIEVRVKDGAAQVLLEVHDRGIGIAPDEHQRIFEQFQRGSSAHNFGGIGLGLWIAREIVHAHGGQIDVRSALASGSTFTVVLPRSASASAGATASP